MRNVFYFSSLLVCLYVFSWDCVTPVTSIADHRERQKYAAVGVEKLKETNTNEFRNLKKKVLNGTIIFWASQVAQWQRSACQCRRCGFSAWVYKIPCSSNSKESACEAGDQGRSSGEGNGNPFQYTCLENSMDREA